MDGLSLQLAPKKLAPSCSSEWVNIEIIKACGGGSSSNDRMESVAGTLITLLHVDGSKGRNSWCTNPLPIALKGFRARSSTCRISAHDLEWKGMRNAVSTALPCGRGSPSRRRSASYIVTAPRTS